MYRLMVVDDSLIIRNKISRASDRGERRFEIVCTASDGYDAIEQCKKHMPDIVTMDITMPGMNGLQTIPKLLEIKPDLQILVVSALSDESTGLEALELGAGGFVVKPFSELELRNALDVLMDFMEDDDDEEDDDE